MKHTLLFAVAFFISFTLLAQAAVETSRDHYGTKVLKGFIAKKDLATDTAFTWFAQTQKNYTPNDAVTKQYATGRDSINFIVFGGTWCDDTKMLLPKFYAVADAAGIPENRITLIGVDRQKKTLFNLTEAFAIKNVPTFIVMKNGKEVGRVVEYGRIGSPEKEVGDIIAAATKK
jgi:thiol-disulfide isomerase/thioredoxin